MPSRLPSIKATIKELEKLMNRLSKLSHEFQYDLNGGAVNSDVIEVVEMWGKVKDFHEELFLLDQGIDIQTENLKDNIAESIKDIVRRRLADNIQSAERKLSRVASIEKKATQLLNEKQIEFTRQKATLKTRPVKERVSVESSTQSAKRATTKKPTPKTDKEFEQQHISNIASRQRQVKKLYEDAIQIVTVALSQITFNGEVFKISDYPLLSNQITSIIKSLKAEIYTTVVNGITDSWELSFDKNNLLVDKRLAGKKPSAAGKKVLYDPNLDALKQFIKRKEQGLNLSDRVWNSLDTYKTEMETALGVGISEGRSAIEMASDLKKYLNDPDKLFRKVRADDGTLKLSKAAKNFHPGQGVYRSSFQNALRVTGSETNMAYRTADYERWLTLPFITGIEIHLSGNHPEYDICDSLAGVYPKAILFRGFHPRCICFATPVMMSDAQYDLFEDAILDGVTPKAVKQLSSIPIKARNWLSSNSERIAGWNSKPFFITDNMKLLKEFL